jgi:hypothetical protein
VASPATLDVRLATLENTVTLEELRDHHGVTPHSVSKALRSDAKGWTCEKGGKLLGFSIGNGLDGEVHRVAVAPGQEGRGIGKSLVVHGQD